MNRVDRRFNISGVSRFRDRMHVANRKTDRGTGGVNRRQHCRHCIGAGVAPRQFMLHTPEAATFTIRDMGPGFNVSEIPAAGDPENFRDGRGRGLVLIQTFMDEVKFNQSGNELTMTKFASPPAKPR